MKRSAERTFVFCGMAIALLLASPAHAGGVAAISDKRVSQYGEALKEAKAALGTEVAEIDASREGAAQQLKAMDPALVIAVGQRALQIARDTLSTTPIVFCMVLERNAPSSRNVTGVPMEIGPGDQLARFRQVLPSAKRFGLIFDPRNNEPVAREAIQIANQLGLSLTVRATSDAKQVPAVANQLAGSIDALWLLPDAQLITLDVFKNVLGQMTQHKIPVFGFLESLTHAGALASVSPDYKEIGRKAGQIAAKILALPADSRLPVPPPVRTQGVLSVNEKTAEELGIQLPAAAPK